MGLLAVLVAVLVLQDGRQQAEPSQLATHRAQPAAASAALRHFVDAVGATDQRLAREAAPSGDLHAETLLAGLVTNAAALSVADFSARYVDEVGAVAPDGSWTAAVELTWRFAGFDRAPARAEVLVHLAGSGAETGIVGFGGAGATSGRRTPLWLQGPLQVVRNQQRVVLVDGTAAEARRIARRVDTGIDVVRRTLPRWQPRVVVEVPSGGAELDETLGAAPGTYAAIAGVTAVVDGSPDGHAPTHVFLNPEVSEALRPAGAQVVMSHELTHVATDAATSPVTGWLLEGFADYVALRDVVLPDRSTLARAVALVRREGVPSHLPGPAEFDTRADHLQAAYEQAWLACRIVAERLGEARLVQVYRAADRGAAVPRALRGAGLSQAELVGLWRARLQDLAR